MTEQFHVSAPHPWGCSGACMPFPGNQNNRFNVNFSCIAVFFFKPQHCSRVAKSRGPFRHRYELCWNQFCNPNFRCLYWGQVTASPRVPILTSRFDFRASGDLSCKLGLQQSNYSPIWELLLSLNLKETESLDFLIKIGQLHFQNFLYYGCQKVPSCSSHSRAVLWSFPMVMNLHAPFPCFLNKRGSLKWTLSQCEDLSWKYSMFSSLGRKAAEIISRIPPLRVSRVLYKWALLENSG